MPVTVTPSSGEAAFVLSSEEEITMRHHGTIVWTNVEHSLPDPNRIFDALSFKFLHDPRFRIVVNDREVGIEHQRIVGKKTFSAAGADFELLCVEVPRSRHRMVEHGVAFWVGGRLVGDPTYNLFGIPLLDGRTTVANSHMFIVKTDGLFNDIESDWTGFRRSERVVEVAGEVGKQVDSIVRKLMAGRISDNKKYAIRENGEEIRKLPPLGRIQVSEFVDELTTENPTMNAEVLTAAVKAAVNLEKSRSGRELLDKLSVISEEDVDRINKLLDTWTMRDAMAVLDELDRRMSVVEALKKLMDDPSADELHSIHPLVTHARWLFGPEFDSPIYASNITIRKAAETVFKKEIDKSGIKNMRQRPDLIFAKESTYALTGTEHVEESNSIVKLSHLLVIELKKGNFTITSKEVQQAAQYVEDLLACEILDGPPYVRAFVVGHKIDKRAKLHQIGRDPAEGIVEPVTFGQLVRTAEVRLFRLQSTISDRYRDVPGLTLVNKIIGDAQGTLFDGEAHAKKNGRKKRGRK